MPTNVVWFERLAYASLALGLVVGALDFANLSKLAPPATLVGTLLVTIGIMVLLVWLIARRKQNWARWLFLVLFLIGLPYFVYNLGQQSLLTVPISLLQAVMQGVALYFVFTAEAAAWLNPIAGGTPVEGEKPKVRMRVAAGQRIVVEPSEATHRRKVDAHIAEMGQQGIPGYVAAPPLFQLLWATGLEVPPPLFLGFVPTMLIMGAPFALVWALLHAFVSSISVALVIAAWAGLIFGALVAAYYWRKSRNLPLPAWEDYLPTG